MYEIVVIGTSWGGLNALSTVVATLPSTFALPIVVVQHRSADAPGMLAELLQTRSRLEIVEVDDKHPFAAGHIYIAPPNYHLLVERGFFSLSTDAPVRYSRPSIDVTFASAADEYGRRTIGIVLTGANEDGALGLKRIADRGGYAIVQDPASAESAIMPRAALRLVPNARVLPLQHIASHLVTIAPPRPPAHGRVGAHLA
ncbi:MAG TPA: chemotaxis protein CheB [Gemmatimonadaceae bacterium]|nr:chemotaxis protein CheB [Gemmatimonadaceae bacterium]